MAALLLSSSANAVAPNGAPQSGQSNVRELATKLEVGDIVFIRVSALPFREIASATETWTNHVGIVVDVSGNEPIIGESRFPFSGTTTFSRFAARSEAGRVAVERLNSTLSTQKQRAVAIAAQKRSGVFYDTGFDLHSRHQFCSRYVREVVNEATGIKIGDIETLSTLLSRNPHTDLRFWRLWYFRGIPWQRETVTPASELRSPFLHKIFDGYV